MSISALKQPPQFPSTPGHRNVPWEQWIQAFKNNAVASGAADQTAMLRKAILNCLAWKDSVSSRLLLRMTSLSRKWRRW
ncbi:hypothetical protein HPB50_012597 [Hyalomma asiaticum]|uniref:Uncharacterized protein n=1 Tax=Hyalomma asiaticum TaxID=266040 RepID=A0ACB7S2R5_HYAAI|nr:hypothetical protein HPB50_012597 [Hyalomma asiaticum]